MGESVDSVLPGAVERASYVLDSNIEFLNDDIEALEEFQNEVSSIDLGRGGSSRGYLSGSREVSDTEQVVELFDDLFYSRQDATDTVEQNAERFDLSMPSAHFLQELFNVANMDKSDALANIQYLDSDNPMAPPHVREVVSLAEYPKANRKEVVEDIEVARSSLLNYQDDLSTLEDHVLHLNEEYTLPMNIDDAATVVRYFDVVEDRIDQLESRRRHELRRMTDIISEHSLETIDTYFEPEGFEDPVLYDVGQLRDSIYEAKENIQIK